MCYGNNTLITGKIIMSKKHYLVYKITNLVNGKIYIGKHETDNLDDGYLGSGKLLKRAIEKYGEENFQREILFECSSKAEMDAREAELVNELNYGIMLNETPLREELIRKKFAKESVKP